MFRQIICHRVKISPILSAVSFFFEVWKLQYWETSLKICITTKFHKGTNALKILIFIPLHFPVCPESCHCSVQLSKAIVIDCNKRSLNEVPIVIPDTVIDIDLANNGISDLNNNSFENCSQLERIDLSNNDLTSIPEDTLKSIFNLKTIRLDDNRLNYNDASLPKNLFKHLYNLKSVSMHQSNNLYWNIVNNF